MAIVRIGGVDSNIRRYSPACPAAAPPDRTLARRAEAARRELGGLSCLDGARVRCAKALRLPGRTPRR